MYFVLLNRHVYILCKVIIRTIRFTYAHVGMTVITITPL